MGISFQSNLLQDGMQQKRLARQQIGKFFTIETNKQKKTH